MKTVISCIDLAQRLWNKLTEGYHISHKGVLANLSANDYQLTHLAETKQN